MGRSPDRGGQLWPFSRAKNANWANTKDSLQQQNPSISRFNFMSIGMYSECLEKLSFLLSKLLELN